MVDLEMAQVKLLFLQAAVGRYDELSQKLAAEYWLYAMLKKNPAFGKSSSPDKRQQTEYTADMATKTIGFLTDARTVTGEILIEATCGDEVEFSANDARLVFLSLATAYNTLGKLRESKSQYDTADTKDQLFDLIGYWSSGYSLVDDDEEVDVASSLIENLYLAAVERVENALTEAANRVTLPEPSNLISLKDLQ